MRDKPLLLLDRDGTLSKKSAFPRIQKGRLLAGVPAAAQI